MVSEFRWLEYSFIVLNLSRGRGLFPAREGIPNQVEFDVVSLTIVS